MLGGVTTGEFGCDVRYEAFDPAHPPRWLDQMLVLAHAHALFTWVEAELRDSDLLSGPEPHAWNAKQPAYEFPTGFPQARALVRRVKDARHWLVGAWAADGCDREVSITVPDLGEYRILARPAGTVHRVELRADLRVVTWLDEDAMRPSLKVSR
jgi:hypothetical protein